MDAIDDDLPCKVERRDRPQPDILGQKYDYRWKCACGNAGRWTDNEARAMSGLNHHIFRRHLEPG